MGRVCKWLILGAVGFTLLGVLYVVLRVVTYEQMDDELHLQAKRDYLQQIERSSAVAGNDRPNIVILLFDDMGYGDIGAFGARAIATPNMDALAAGGTRFTRYYSPSSVCSPSRAGMMTGRYPVRAGFSAVVFPEGHPISNMQKYGGLNLRLPAEEITLSEVLKAAGYSTGMVGKWHMGDQSPSLPNDRGFDSYYGALYSNDMKPFAFYRNREIAVEAPVDQTTMNERYTKEVVDFIAAQGEQPFFLYYAHNFPHIPLYSSPEQNGKSNGGLYGDVIEDLDRSVGEVIAALERKGVLDNTLILLTSDNGPWYQGSPGKSRGRKNQTWEGGMRVPFIAYWPGRIPSAASVDTPISGVDVFPTVAGLLDLPLPADRMIDGTNILGVLTGESALPERFLYYFSMETLDAVRDSRFKYQRRRGVRVVNLGDSFAIYRPKGPWLFDFSLDVQESYDVSRRHPEDMERLRRVFEDKVEEMTENPRGWR